MRKLILNDKMPNFNVSTLKLGDTTIKNLVGNKKTGFIFLRYYGCTLCQLDMALYAEEFNEIVKSGGQFYLVLQSQREVILEDIKDVNVLPYDIILDPSQSIYKELDIDVAKNKEEMIDENTMSKIEKARARFKHGAYEGEENQLPAAVIVSSDLNVEYIKYGKSVNDVLSPEQLGTLLG